MIDKIQELQAEIAYLKAENKEYRRKFDKLKKVFIEVVEDRYERALNMGNANAQVERYETYEDAGILDEL